MQQGLKVPFVLKGNQRVDDTPIHKLLREAITNAVVHADFYGRQGLVIQKSEDGYKLSNPGSVRISISEAINGGISDPRNGIMLKMFSLIDFGERAGSGLSGIIKVWERVYHTPVLLEETHNNGVDRTILTLSTAGNEQDIDAMLALYGGSNNETDQTDQRSDQTDQRLIGIDGQKALILDLIKANPNISRNEISKSLGLHASSVKRRLDSLVSEGKIRRMGADFGGYWEIL